MKGGIVMAKNSSNKAANNTNNKASNSKASNMEVGKEMKSSKNK